MLFSSPVFLSMFQIPDPECSPTDLYHDDVHRSTAGRPSAAQCVTDFCQCILDLIKCGKHTEHVERSVVSPAYLDLINRPSLSRAINTDIKMLYCKY